MWSCVSIYPFVSDALGSDGKSDRWWEKNRVWFSARLLLLLPTYHWRSIPTENRRDEQKQWKIEGEKNRSKIDKSFSYGWRQNSGNKLNQCVFFSLLSSGKYLLKCPSILTLPFLPLDRHCCVWKDHFQIWFGHVSKRKTIRFFLSNKTTFFCQYFKTKEFHSTLVFLNWWWRWADWPSLARITATHHWIYSGEKENDFLHSSLLFLVFSTSFSFEHFLLSSFQHVSHAFRQNL